MVDAAFLVEVETEDGAHWWVAPGGGWGFGLVSRRELGGRFDRAGAEREVAVLREAHGVEATVVPDEG